MTIPPSMQPVFWSPGMTIEALEQQVILAAYSFYRGVKTVTAESLGISVRNLSDKLDKYAVDEAAGKLTNDERSEARALELQYARFGGRPTPTPKPRTVNGEEAVTVYASQSASNPTSQPALSVPERKEVQSVLPRQVAATRHSGRR